MSRHSCRLDVGKVTRDVKLGLPDPKQDSISVK